ncbi:hypothetical protein CFHF_23185 [Caulobacter flavus]|uniref:Uncharacterized protein n=1 Tax=Caulobacter flavus TaxID=1679497 RepID=A0A2N5CMB6_9CAUL|nr:hypothetical protein [Caulobacter flavus]AYV44784.1 hypothetical protein C1707_00070 [Caulobacter flavus]PLR07125.1 hypothetical protein CFHF_23185 [Caulobacter flavus]
MTQPFQLSLAPRQLTQTINPWSWRFGDFSLLTVNLGQSRNPAIEARVLDEVGSYGRQIGRISEALLVLVDWAEKQPDGPSSPAFQILRDQVAHVALIKKAVEAEAAG